MYGLFVQYKFSFKKKWKQSWTQSSLNQATTHSLLIWIIIRITAISERKVSQITKNHNFGHIQSIFRVSMITALFSMENSALESIVNYSSFNSSSLVTWWGSMRLYPKSYPWMMLGQCTTSNYDYNKFHVRKNSLVMADGQEMSFENVKRQTNSFKLILFASYGWSDNRCLFTSSLDTGNEMNCLHFHTWQLNFRSQVVLPLFYPRTNQRWSYSVRPFTKMPTIVLI